MPDTKPQLCQQVISAKQSATAAAAKRGRRSMAEESMDQ
eukprot:CAMPEP_0177336470 /NCGR_PEP_ID=MMETSP0368-20130122/23805_1 /TAXON_ID=447022 ORGANISM="Scrippsiella hangoei-like, Strain SHHI-4" /NCGR_SAMPLE_ID=MMETSP0368 /ASSEMBLY_ACC=CAM_ASM_000363 /LENGTH=38 /DNA_ID= /DNA_START= /DNA_END= /DNA_ORIENTATION=